MKRDWQSLGPKLQGKLHIFAGADDTFFLTNAVMDMEDFLQTTTSPVSDAEVGAWLCVCVCVVCKCGTLAP